MMRRRKARPWIPEWRRTLRFRGTDIDREVDEELRFHLEMREHDFLQAGMTRDEARDAALARFGDVGTIRESLRTHDLLVQRRRRRVETMETLSQDVRYAVRKLTQAPAFALSVVLVLALGIGINTAVYSAVDAALLRPLPFADGDRLALLDHVNIPSSFRINNAPPPKRSPDIHDVAAMSDVVSAWGAYAPGGLNLTGIAEPMRVRIALATPGLFPMLGAQPALGRTFVEDEAREEHADVVILSHALWLRHFGGDSSVVGKTLALNNVVHTIVGVMPASFVFPASTDLWIPLTVPFTWSGARREAIRAFLPSRTIIKLAPGVTADEAGKRVRALFEPYATPERPVRFAASELVMPMQQTMVKDRRTALLVLMGAAVLVLLTACANVTNLLLARAATRRREFDIRSALGASRGRIVQQLLVEALLLALLGGALGVLVANAGFGVLTSLLPAQLVDVLAPRLDLRILFFSLMLATATGLVFGLWPAFGAARRKPAAGGGLGVSFTSTAGDGSRLRRAFVVSEIAFALMLSIGAGLMLRSFQQLVTTDAGMDVSRIASAELTLPRSKYGSSVTRAQFYRSVIDRLEQTPGVTSAAVINELPLRAEGGIGLSVEAEGRPRDPGEERLYPLYLRVTPGYFATVGLTILQGRALTAQDDSSRPGAVINQTMARELWGDENPVGRRFSFGTMPGEKPDYITVVGVAQDARTFSIEQAPMAQMYFPFFEAPTEYAGVVARGAGDARSLLVAIREAIRATDAEQPIYNLRTLDEVVSATLAPRRTNTILIATFGVFAVVLAALGVYAVISYGVAQRTREIGIRVALGATVSDVLKLVLKEGIVLALVGVAAGLAAAWGLSRLIESMLYGVSARDPITFAVAPLVVLVLAILAVVVPARRASRVNALEAIRME